MNKIFTITILILMPFSFSVAELYKWTDENGKVHYGDKAPNESTTPIDEKDLPPLNNLPSASPNTQTTSENNSVADHGEYRSSRHSISGRLLFDGEPIKVNAKEDVSIWVRDEGTGKSANLHVEFNVREGSLYVENLKPGEYGMSIHVDSNKTNPPLYPGDYRAWANFKIRRGYSIQRDLNLNKIIHLTAPQDNNKIIKKWSNPCGKKMSFASPVSFRWKSLGDNVVYRYAIRNNPCKPFKYGEIVEHGETTDTFVTLKLPRTKSSHQYMMTISALRDKRLIGSLMTHGDNGYGWDYRFIVY